MIFEQAVAGRSGTCGEMKPVDKLQVTEGRELRCGGPEEDNGDHLQVKVMKRSPGLCEGYQESNLITAYVGQQLHLDCCVVASPQPT